MYDAFGSLIADNIAYFQSQTEFLYKDHEIKKSGDAEIQHLIDQKVGVIVSKSEVDEVLKRGGKVLNTKMLFKRN